MQTITTWNQAAEVKAKEIFEAVQDSRLNTSYIRHTFERLSASYFHDTSIESHHRVASLWIEIGASSIAWGRDNGFAIDYEFLVETLIRKQRDYGHHNIAKYGRSGLIIRVHDKISRLENLTKEKNKKGEYKKAANEPISDTILDIAGYSAIGLMWESQSFMLPLE